MRVLMIIPSNACFCLFFSCSRDFTSFSFIHSRIVTKHSIAQTIYVMLSLKLQFYCQFEKLQQEVLIGVNSVDNSSNFSNIVLHYIPNILSVYSFGHLQLRHRVPTIKSIISIFVYMLIYTVN